MGTTLSNMQILGAEEDAVRAALPGALVGRWSERFVTACPQVSRPRSSASASSLSARLSCTVLLVEMFDGDALWLTLFQAGKKLTALRSLPPPWSASAGSPKLFCAALGLPEELAPQLRRFFTGCSMQEETLAVLQSLLGAPLFLRWDSPPPEEAVPADAAPLLQWIADHPLPPKIKNQRRAELLQEIPDRYLEPGLILRPAVHKDGPHPGCYAVHQAGDILGYAKRGGERCRPLPDGRLELLPLADPPIPRELPAGVSPEKAPPAGEDGIVPLHYDYAFGDDRLVTLTPLYLGSGSPYCTAILHDTAGLLSPRVLTLDGEPVNGTLSLLPDGGFLAGIAPRFDGSRPPVQTRGPALARYDRAGNQLWAVRGARHPLGLVDGLIYALTSRVDGEQLLAIRMDGSTAARCPIPFSCSGVGAHIIGGVPYLLEEGEYQKDALLHRLTPGLRPDGQVRVPFMSHPALSPDGSLLYCSGFGSGLQVMDAATLEVLARLDRPDDFCTPVVDRQNHLWVSNKSYFECYDRALTLISRHRLAGDVRGFHFTAAGELCAVTFQDRRYLTRVYRFY